MKLEEKMINIITSKINADRIPIHPEWVSLIPEGESGNCKIEKFSITAGEAMIANAGAVIQGMSANRFVHPGDYTRLLIDGRTMMSDTQAEFLDHAEMFRMASGNVLVMGLGLGCAASVIASMPEVTKVTIVEISDDVIRLVAPTLYERFGDKIEIHHADAFTWTPPKGQRYSVGWFDIWIDISDMNIPEMTKFKRRFSKHCNWMGCWSEPESRALKRALKRMKDRSMARMGGVVI